MRTRSAEAVRPGRWMARRSEPFAVFLFGVRLNRLAGLRRYLWALGVLRRVLADLEAHPERGFLAGRVYRSGRTLVAVQYWESFDALDAWARDHALPHRGSWQRYLRESLDDPTSGRRPSTRGARPRRSLSLRLKEARHRHTADALGLWHETYLASPGSWEGVYVNLPPWGLGAGARLVEMRSTEGSARDRLREQLKRAARRAGDEEAPPPP